MKNRRIPHNNPILPILAILLAASLPGVAHADEHKSDGSKSGGSHMASDDHGADKLRVHDNDRDRDHRHEREHECDDDRRHCPVSP